ncbi:MAG: hypothetical protein AAF399_04455 [Bacteroidota bacterium]
MRPFFLSLFVLTLTLFSCKVTKKAYESGDYETAVFNSIERLRKSPNNKKSRETLKLAYPELVETLLDQVAQESRSSNPLRYERMADHYDLLNKIHDEIRRSPAAKKVITNPRFFGSEYAEATQRSAEARYALGKQELDRGRQGDRESAKEAYYHFAKAQEWQPGYRDAADQQMEALDYATILIQIESIPMHSRALQLSNEFFENQLAEYIASAPFSPFVRFLVPGEASRLNRQPDQILQMTFDDFVVGQAYVKETVSERLRDSVVVGEVEIKEDSVADVYGTVEAKVHRFHKEISSRGLLDFRVLDARSGAVITQQKFPGTFIWVDRWGYYQGDKRALDEEDQQYMRKNRELPNPPPQDLFIEFTRPIFSQVTNFVGNYYQNY